MPDTASLSTFPHHIESSFSTDVANMKNGGPLVTDKASALALYCFPFESRGQAAAAAETPSTPPSEARANQ